MKKHIGRVDRPVSGTLKNSNEVESSHIVPLLLTLKKTNICSPLVCTSNDTKVA